MFLDNKPYAIMVIAAFVGFAILLMFWALYGTNGPSAWTRRRRRRKPSAARRPPPIA
jgi:hypothetical protein